MGVAMPKSPGCTPGFSRLSLTDQPIGGDAVTIDRRQFVAAAAAGLGSQLVSTSRDALAQTVARPLPPDSGLFPGFQAKWVRTNGADIFLRHGGTGPPLLLLHGNPQSHVCWHKVAGAIASQYHVVVTDLRGYGDSVGPTDGGA